MTTPPIQLPRDAQAATPRELRKLLERLWTAEPRLRPSPELDDVLRSYPPAIALDQPQHRGEPSEAQFVAAAIGRHRAASYFFHFPFCVYRCRYCFHWELTTKRSDERMARYVEALLADVRRVRALAPDLRPIQIQLGGGTPTALPTALLDRFLTGMLDQLGRPQSLASTAELKPLTATREKLALLRQAGFRRLTFGVQTLNAELYAFHHHGEELRVALDAITRARELGFEHITLDLMTGLERQTRISWRGTLAALERLIDLGTIDAVQVHRYHDDPRSPTFAVADALPGFHELAHSEAAARSLFEHKGWKEHGLRSFRAPRERRAELLDRARAGAEPIVGEVLVHGFGNSAISLGERASYLAPRSLEDYCAAVEAGRLPISHWRELDGPQRAARDLSFELLTRSAVRVRALERRHGREPLRRHRALLDRWVELGLGEHHRLAGSFTLTNLGKLVCAQMVTAHFVDEDRQAWVAAMGLRQALGRRYRGY